MKQLQVYPNDWQCTLAECPAGLFVYGDTLCFKSEYRHEGHTEAFVVESGEAFWGGMYDPVMRDALMVQPCDHIWTDDSEE